MKILRKLAIFLPALALVLVTAAPPVEAGGSFGMHVGSNGFGVSVGFGDWSVYTRSWSDLRRNAGRLWRMGVGGWIGSRLAPLGLRELATLHLRSVGANRRRLDLGRL